LPTATNTPTVTVTHTPLPTATTGPSGNQYQIVIDSAAHQRYGLYYPVTYMFQIPGGSSSLVAQYRFNMADAWVTLPGMTTANFFNGINAARFDYPANRAYLSVAFPDTSDVIYLRVLSGTAEVPLTYLGIPPYYDNRSAAVTVTLDDWDAQSEFWDTVSRVMTNDRLHFSVGIMTGFEPDWSLIQHWYDQGYLEPASHSRSHSCSDAIYLSAGGFDYQVSGSRDDILANLSMRHPYGPAYFEPCGFESRKVRAAVVNANYLADRGANTGLNSFSPWWVDGAYQQAMYTYDTQAWSSSGSAARLAEANARFDAVTAAGGIYHLFDHPVAGVWTEGSYRAQHAGYISNRLNIWYAAFGELYLYHYIQEQGKVLVYPVGAQQPTLTPTPTATPANAVVNPANISSLPAGTTVLIDFNNLPNPVAGQARPANYAGITWSALVAGAPYAGGQSWNIYIANGGSQATITFPRQVIVQSLLTSSLYSSIYTLSSAGNPDMYSIPLGGVPGAIETGWTNPVTRITIESTSADQALDDLRFVV
jgi:hypothetical protein